MEAPGLQGWGAGCDRHVLLPCSEERGRVCASEDGRTRVRPSMCSAAAAACATAPGVVRRRQQVRASPRRQHGAGADGRRSGLCAGGTGWRAVRCLGGWRSGRTLDFKRPHAPTRAERHARLRTACEAGDWCAAVGRACALLGWLCVLGCLVVVAAAEGLAQAGGSAYLGGSVEQSARMVRREAGATLCCFGGHVV